MRKEENELDKAGQGRGRHNTWHCPWACQDPCNSDRVLTCHCHLPICQCAQCVPMCANMPISLYVGTCELCSHCGCGPPLPSLPYRIQILSRKRTHIVHCLLPLTSNLLYFGFWNQVGLLTFLFPQDSPLPHASAIASLYIITSFLSLSLSISTPFFFLSYENNHVQIPSRFLLLSLPPLLQLEKQAPRSSSPTRRRRTTTPTDLILHSFLPLHSRG